MSQGDAIIEMIATVIAICVICMPVLIAVKLGRFIFRKIKQVINKRKSNKIVPPSENWNTEWKWNEKKQLWEHPSSKTTENQQEEITIIIPEKVKDFIQKSRNEKNNEASKNHSKITKEKLIYTYPKTELKIEDREENNPELDFENAYQRKTLFTKNEWQNYKKLKKIAEDKGLVVCPKVRLFDLLEPRSDKKRKLTYRYKIQAKHVDFVICDQNMNIIAILELDDNSHYDPERIKRDDFVNKILISVGYTVIHTKYIESNVFDMLLDSTENV
ncbi:MAG: DUF2726 domain-containing protein [Oscillospiraceae bacterium]|nr:DUF2726 domain-containing protein [Oscillospiraceae bacterium]